MHTHAPDLDNPQEDVAVHGQERVVARLRWSLEQVLDDEEEATVRTDIL